MVYDLLIAGAGPAGSAAAISAARLGWKTLIVDGGLANGALGPMPAVWDYPGCENGTAGVTLLEQMRRQATQAGAEHREVEITSAAMGATAKQLFARDGAKFEGRAVILATGCCQRPTALPGEREFLGRGVSYSIVRDAPLVREKHTVVYGKTAEAARAALTAARFGAKVTLVVPSSKLDLPDAEIEGLKKQAVITLLFSASLKQMNGTERVTSITILSAGQEKEVPTDCVFLYHQGHRINTIYLAGTVDCSPEGLVLVNPQLETSIPGVFAAGDVIAGEPQIPVITAAQGVMAALSADKYLRNATS